MKTRQDEKHMQSIIAADHTYASLQKYVIIYISGGKMAYGYVILNRDMSVISQRQNINAIPLRRLHMCAGIPQYAIHYIIMLKHTSVHTE